MKIRQITYEYEYCGDEDVIVAQFELEIKDETSKKIFLQLYERAYETIDGNVVVWREGKFRTRTFEQLKEKIKQWIQQQKEELLHKLNLIEDFAKFLDSYRDADV